MKSQSSYRALALGLGGLILALAPTRASALYIDGEGHYTVRGAVKTQPGFHKDSGLYQGFEQFFDLNGELRMNDQSSFHLRLGLFDDESFWGDEGIPEFCSEEDANYSDNDPLFSNRGTQRVCGPGEKSKGKRHQSTGEPRYKPYIPRIREAYARYAFEYCILEAGRRPRHWGMGIFLNSGKGPFDRDASVFDGVGCRINLQKIQNLGFHVGFDKLAETGGPIDEIGDKGEAYGPTKSSDDIYQLYLSVEYLDKKSSWEQQIGLYFANVSGDGSNTDIKFFDAYANVSLDLGLQFKSEAVWRSGRSADPNWTYMGGIRDRGEEVTNKVDSFGIAGAVEFHFAKSGARIGPEEFNEGNASEHVVYLDAAYAPGDRDGYFIDQPDSKLNKRNFKAKAFALHKNFKPALILFNGTKQDREINRVDGIYDPQRVMNAFVLGLGYRYENQQYGDFESKIIYAKLDESAGPEQRAESKANPHLPVGYYDKGLGYELDIKYSKKLGRDVSLGVEAAAAFPGSALKDRLDQKKVRESLLFQTFATFKF